MENEKPKFKIGDEAYIVTIWRKREKADISKEVVSGITIYDGKFYYTLVGKEEDYDNDYLYTFEEAIAVAKARKRPNTTNK